MKHTVAITVDQRAVTRRREADAKREAMREGIVRKAQTFRAAKGKGSYRRKTKHREAI